MKDNKEIWKWAMVLGGAGLLYYLYGQNKTTTTVSTAPIPITDSATSVIPQTVVPSPPSTVIITDPNAIKVLPAPTGQFARIPGLTLNNAAPGSWITKALTAQSHPLIV